jgi:hypothetical protein
MTRAVAIAVLAGVGVAVVAIGRWPRSTVPTVGELLGYLMRRPAGRALVLAGWMWAGWHFFGR